MNDQSRLSPAVQGALWMVLAAALFSLMAIAIQAAAKGVHPLETVFFRNFVSLLVMLPVFWRKGFGRLRTRRIGVHLARAGAGLGSTFLWFSAMSWMPLAEATALGFTAPLFTTVLAALFLGETVRARRWIAVAVGFAGAVIILRPGVEVVSPLAFVMLGGAFFIAIGAALIKALTRTEEPDTIVFYLNALTTPASFIAALFVWVWPSPVTLAWLIVVGVCAVLGHLAYTRSFAVADASAVVPYDYSRLIFTAILAFFIFGQVPDIFVWTGSGVIALATLYITRRETAAVRNRRPDP
jgi:drug/metabolite transporter (DMT)-like permease